MAARPKTVIDLLAEQPEAELLRMREANRLEAERAAKELSRLQVEGRQIELALTRQGRGRVTLTNDQVHEVAKTVDSPMSAADVQRALADQGIEATVNTVRNHLNRLVERGLLERDGNRYVAKSDADADIDFSPAAADDDIPF